MVVGGYAMIRMTTLILDFDIQSDSAVSKCGHEPLGYGGSRVPHTLAIIT